MISVKGANSDWARSASEARLRSRGRHSGRAAFDHALLPAALSSGDAIDGLSSVKTHRIRTQTILVLLSVGSARSPLRGAADPSRTSGSGTFATLRLRRAMSGFRSKAEDMCSY
jgi:hypothetical protein